MPMTKAFEAKWDGMMDWCIVMNWMTFVWAGSQWLWEYYD